MSIFGNLSDLAHEIRSGVGTVLTILGSHLESTERARVDATAVCAGCGHARVDHVELVGPCGHRTRPSMAPCTCRQFVGSVGAQWLTEFEDPGDGEFTKDTLLGVCPNAGAICNCTGACLIKSSAAVSAAADPSPTVPNAHSVVGDCPGSDSVILPTVEPGQPNLVNTFHCQDCGVLNLFSVPPVVAGESPRGVSTDQPSLGEPVTHEDLAAHLTGAAIRANTGHPDVLIDAFASSLLADFNVTLREAAGE